MTHEAEPESRTRAEQNRIYLAPSESMTCEVEPESRTRAEQNRIYLAPSESATRDVRLKQDKGTL